MKRLFLCCLAAALATSASAATLEVPTNGGYASGIGYFSGWKCPPNTNIALSIDGGAPIPMATGIRRGDTAGICGNSGLNGYIAQINFGNLGDGIHTAVVRQNGVQFASSSFTVTTFGQSFMSGATGTFVLSNFPTAGRSATVQWSEGAQNFVIIDTSGSGPVTPTPTPGPPHAQVRYGNDLTCNGLTFTSTLRANGFTWVSPPAAFSGYQAVDRSTLGSFTETNNSSCPNETFLGILALTPGRRYALVQTLQSGLRVLLQFDEGAVSAAAESQAAGEISIESLLRNGSPIAALEALDDDKNKEGYTE